VREHLTDWVTDLTPGSFSAVMATGIVSIAAVTQHWTALSIFLYYVAAVVWGLLALGYVLRALLVPRRVGADLENPRVSFAYFTVVAGSGVLGTRAALAGAWGASSGLAMVALGAWLGLIYYLPWRLLSGNTASVSDMVNGSWLLATVGTEALSVLAATWWARLGRPTTLALAGIGWWGLGAVLYALTMVAVMRRLFFSRVEPEDLNPPYWINMGGVAITTLAGSLWASVPPSDPLVSVMRPALVGITLMLWTFGTWWIPLLVVAGSWRHLVRRLPLRYDPAFWSMVFPLGMYTVATYHLSRLQGLEPLAVLVRPAFGVALGVWVLVALGWASRTAATIRRRHGRPRSTQQDCDGAHTGR
jgi:tellurite resistance protein TehA-like permease